jgi:DNA-binding NtrC family response regulator
MTLGVRSQERPALLVVEDDPDNADLLVRALRQLASIEVCADGAAAVERVRDGRFLAVIADQVLPGITGVELLEQVARVSPQTERILVSGFASAQVLTDAINRGNVGHFLPKPIEVGELVRLVARLVAQSAPEKAQRALVIAERDILEVAEATLAALPMPFDLCDSVAAARKLGTPQGGYVVILWDTGITRHALATLEEVAALAPGAALLCVERQGGDRDTPRLLAAGVDDVIWRPLRGDELAVRIRRVLDRRRLLADAQRVRRAEPQGLRELIGASAAMRSIFDTIERVASTDATVLIRGETGTGKELVARIVHALSLRRDRPFVTVNCAALPETLVESELFGHERGAFTGASAKRIGRFERADGGTLFIDEVGDVPPLVQVKLLRALQERTFERVGGNDTLHVNIRLVAATNRNLERMLEKNQFREDLFYRLNVVPIQVPPLRARIEDIWPLAQHYLGEYQRRMGKEGIRVSDSMRRALESYAWPGNVRELINVVERIVALTAPFSVADLPNLIDLNGLSGDRGQGGTPAMPAARGEPGPEAPIGNLKDLVGRYERGVIERALERTGGNRSRAARELGLTRQGLALKLTKYGL